MYESDMWSKRREEWYEGTREVGNDEKVKRSKEWSEVTRVNRDNRKRRDNKKSKT